MSTEINSFHALPYIAQEDQMCSQCGKIILQGELYMNYIGNMTKTLFLFERSWNIERCLDCKQDWDSIIRISVAKL